jgi:hypothetical protein
MEIRTIGTMRKQSVKNIKKKMNNEPKDSMNRPKRQPTN